MSASDVINACEFVASRDVKFAKPRMNKSGGKAVSILNSATSKQLYLTTPLMLTWGINEFRDEKTGKVSYDMALQFPRDDQCTPESDAFLKNIQDFEQYMKQSAVENARDWLGKPKVSMEVLDELFTPILKYSKNPQTLLPDLTKKPTLKIKLDFYEGQFKNTEIYDYNTGARLFPGAASPVDLITKQSNVATMIQCGGLWFANGKFGVTWKLVQAVVVPKPSMTGKCMLTLAPTAKTNGAAAAAPASVATSAGHDDYADDDDGDSAAVTSDSAGLLVDDEPMPPVADEPEPSPSPVPVVAADPAEPPTKMVKKVIRKVAPKA